MASFFFNIVLSSKLEIPIKMYFTNNNSFYFSNIANKKYKIIDKFLIWFK